MRGPHAPRVAPLQLRFFAVKVVVCAVVLFILTTLHCAAGSVSVGEDEVKAAFVFNFAKFVEWPAGTSSGVVAPLRLCVMAGGPFEHTLKEVVRGKLVNGHPLQVEHPRDVKEAKGCHVLFFSRWIQDNDTAAVLRGVAGAGVLTVGETEGFARQGGIINLVLENNHVGFEINVDAADRAGVKISSKLLSLAKITRDGAAREN